MQNVFDMIGGAGGIGNIISKFRRFDRNGDGQVKIFITCFIMCLVISCFIFRKTNFYYNRVKEEIIRLIFKCELLSI
jgi:hypothetical protein